MIIRAIENINTTVQKHNSTVTQKGKQFNSLNFTGKERIFYNKGGILYKDNKRHTGTVGKDLSDGCHMLMQYIKGLLVTAVKLSPNKFYLHKFSEKGEEVKRIPLKRKILYQKDYKYENNKLIEVKKDNESVYTKHWVVNLSSDTPIETHINGDNIIIYQNYNNKKKLIINTLQGTRSQYEYQNDVVIEKRFRQIMDEEVFKQKFREFLQSGNIPLDFGIKSIPTKTLVRKIKSPQEYLQCTNYNSTGQIANAIFKDEKGQTLYKIFYIYDNSANLMKRVVLDTYGGKKIEIFDSSQRILSSKSYDKKGKICSEITCKYNPDTNRLQSTLYTGYDSKKNKIYIKSAQEIGNLFTEIEEYPQKNRGSYSVRRLFNIDTQEMMEEVYMAPDNSIISKNQFMKMIYKD